MAETAAQIAQHSSARGDSVDLINAVIAGTQMSDESADEKIACVDRNVEHLELMLTRDYWTSEDMTDVDSAIVSGNAYNA